VKIARTRHFKASDTLISSRTLPRAISEVMTTRLQLDAFNTRLLTKRIPAHEGQETRHDMLTPVLSKPAAE